MVTRNWKAVVQIGGTVAASLPSSARRASKELDRLSTAQRIDRLEANRLGAELKSLRRGTQEYRTALAQQAAVKTRLAERSVRIRELGERAGEATGILGRFGGTLKSIGPYGAAAAAGVGLATAAVTALVAITNKYADEARELSRTSIALDVDPGELYRYGAALRTVTGDLASAQQQAAALTSAAQQTRLAQRGLVNGFGDIALGASRAGVSIDSITSGDYRRVVADIRAANERGIGTDQIVAGLRQVPGYTDETIQTLLLLATDADAARRALENFNNARPPSPEQIRRLREWDDGLASIKTSFRETGRSAVTEFTPALTSVASTLDDLEPAIDRALGSLASSVNRGVADLQRLALAGEGLAATWDVSSAGIRVAWWQVAEAVSGVEADVLARLERLVGGFASVAESVKKATGGVVDFTGASDRALTAIGELRQSAQGENAEAAERLSKAGADLRSANRRLSAAYQADQALRRGEMPARREPAREQSTAAPAPEAPSSVESPAVQPEPAQRPRVPVVEPEPARRPESPAVQPEPAQRPRVPVVEPEPARRPELPAVQPEPAQRPRVPVVEPEPARRPELPAVQPEPAQRPRVPVVEPEPARRPELPAVQPGAVRQPNVVEQYNTFYIDGVTDIEGALATIERSTTRMVRELA